MGNKQKIIIGIGVIFLLIVMLTINLFLINNQDAVGSVIYNIEELDLAINKVPNSALIFIAEEKGYFNEEGLNINYIGFPTGKLALDALIGGQVDIATTADVPIALAGLANQPFSAIATIEYSTDNIQVIARKDSGIRKPTDLKGKNIATTRGGGPLFYTHKFLERYNMDISDISLINLNPSDMVTALTKGDIDAFIVFEPSPSTAKKVIGEGNIISFSPNDLYGETWNMVVMNEFEKDNKETILKFLKALIKAEKFYNENREESYEIVSRYSETEIEILKNILKRQNIGVVLNNYLTDYLDEEAEWAIEQGLTSSKNIPNYRDHIQTDYLKELEPEKVTI